MGCCWDASWSSAYCAMALAPVLFKKKNFGILDLLKSCQNDGICVSPSPSSCNITPCRVHSAFMKTVKKAVVYLLNHNLDSAIPSFSSDALFLFRPMHNHFQFFRPASCGCSSVPSLMAVAPLMSPISCYAACPSAGLPPVFWQRHPRCAVMS